MIVKKLAPGRYSVELMRGAEFCRTGGVPGTVERWIVRRDTIPGVINHAPRRTVWRAESGHRVGRIIEAPTFRTAKYDIDMDYTLACSSAGIGCDGDKS